VNSCDPKHEAARGLVEEFHSAIEDAGIIGVGTGSTTSRAIEELERRGLLKGKTLVASSLDTALKLKEMGYTVVQPHIVDSIDFYFDGADEVVAETLDLLKGRGAAMLGEKILASMAKVRVYVVDDGKIVGALGSRRPVPIEVVPWALSHVLRVLASYGFSAAPRLGASKDGPVVSDWGGIVVDVNTGPIEDPAGLDARLRSIPGVVVTGIFHGLADAVVVGLRRCGYRVLRLGG
jgi:ribose 5-phosphate isomerase A